MILRYILVIVLSLTIMIFVGLLVRANPKQSGKVALTEFINETGWSSSGLVFFLGLLPGITTINGFDSSAHMADEMPNPAVQIPKIMMSTAVLSGITAIPMTFVYVFCTVDPAALLTPIGGQPIVQLYNDSFRNQGLTVSLLVIQIVLLLIGSGSTTTACSRVLWSLARDQCWPGSRYLARTAGKEELPTVAVYVTLIISCLIGLLIFGSQTALSALASAAAICNYISVAIPVGLSVFSKRNHLKRPHYFNLGRWGLFVNIVALAWMVLMSIFLAFPQYYPVTADTMNYAVAFVGAAGLLGAVNWFVLAKKHYKTPRPMLGPNSGPE